MSVDAGKVQDGPDFICIGAQKAGTGWLYEQLRHHPDFWMPPLKELHYFDRLFCPGSPRRTLPLARKQAERIKIAHERAVNESDRDFLNRFEQLCSQQSLELEDYANLFEPKRELLAGDITPGYSTLDEPTIQKIVGRFAATKIIFIARDPVERAWSQLSMYVRRGLIEPFEPDDFDRISEHLKRPEIQARSYPTQIVRRWRAQVSPDLFQLYFFDDLKRDPARLRGSIIVFLGGDPEKPSGTLPADFNAKATKQKLPLTARARAHLARFFEGELQACADELGGSAMSWLKRYDR
jgi:Sulfotransferase family